ncbi:MAG TPA: redoxin domain-containing protein [Bacteroidia bacterium]|jgi:peroxiredoxin|nr:redoxin domain-containing protein [Bacteroidia bacterium]
MKKLIRVLPFLLLSSLLLAKGDPEGASIKITVKGFKEGTTCNLVNYYGDQYFITDSAKVGANGEMLFNPSTKYPEGIYFLLPPERRKYFDFIIDKNQHFTMETDTLDCVAKMKVKGSEENEFFYDYQRFMMTEGKIAEPLRAALKSTKNKDSIKLITEKIQKIDAEVRSFRDIYAKNHPESFVVKLFKSNEEVDIPQPPLLPNGKIDSLFQFRYYKTHFFDNIDFNDERMLRTPFFHPKIKQYLENLNSPVPDSLNSACDYLVEKGRNNTEVFKYLVYWLTLHYESSKIMGQDAIFVHMVKKYYMTHQAYWVDSTQLEKIVERALTLEPILIGKKAPPITMLDSINKPSSLYDLKGKYIVVVFWDEDCGHCQKEIPKLKELYDTKLKEMGVRVYAIATEEKPGAWKKFILTHKLDWINVHQPDDYKRAVIKKIYDIQTTPYIYLLDENKIIKAKHMDVEQLGELIDAIEKDKMLKK